MVRSKWVLRLVLGLALIAGVSGFVQAESTHMATHAHVASVGHYSGHYAGHGWGGGWGRRPVVVAGWWGWGACGYGPWWRDPFYVGPYGLCGWDPYWPDVQPSGQPGVAYQWDPKTHRYVAMVPPAPPVDSAPSADLFMYPRNGQSDDQQAKDKFECHQWAAKQSGFDPTVAAPANQAPAEIAAHTIDYRRAMSACLDGRGYSVQ